MSRSKKIFFIFLVTIAASIDSTTLLSSRQVASSLADCLTHNETRVHKNLSPVLKSSSSDIGNTTWFGDLITLYTIIRKPRWIKLSPRDRVLEHGPTQYKNIMVPDHINDTLMGANLSLYKYSKGDNISFYKNSKGDNRAFYKNSTGDNSHIYKTRKNESDFSVLFLKTKRKSSHKMLNSQEKSLRSPDSKVFTSNCRHHLVHHYPDSPSYKVPADIHRTKHHGSLVDIILHLLNCLPGSKSSPVFSNGDGFKPTPLSLDDALVPIENTTTRGRNQLKRALYPWLKMFHTETSKRKHQSLSINNALMTLTDMVLEHGREKLMRNRDNLRYHMYIQG